MIEQLLDSGWVVIALIGLLILLFNLSLIYGLLSGGTRRQIEMLRRAAHKARNPWQRQAQDLKDLHRRVQALKQPDSPDESD